MTEPAYDSAAEQEIFRKVVATGDLVKIATFGACSAVRSVWHDVRKVVCADPSRPRRDEIRKLAMENVPEAKAAKLSPEERNKRLAMLAGELFVDVHTLVGGGAAVQTVLQQTLLHLSASVIALLAGERPGTPFGFGVGPQWVCRWSIDDLPDGTVTLREHDLSGEKAVVTGNKDAGLN